MVQIHSPRPLYPPQIQQLHAAFLEATAPRFGCESCETLVGKTKPRPIFSHHSRRYFTSSRSCSAYWSVRSLCACPIHIFSKSHGTRFLRSQEARKRRKMWKPHFSLPIFFRIGWRLSRRTFRCDNGSGASRRHGRHSLADFVRWRSRLTGLYAQAVVKRSLQPPLVYSRQRQRRRANSCRAQARAERPLRPPQAPPD